MTGVLSFITSMGIAKAGGIGQSIASALARFDPDTASQVDIDAMNAEFQKLGGLVAKAETDEARTHQAVTTLEERLARTVKAAGILSGQIDQATPNNATLASTLSVQLTTLVSQIEEVGGDPADGTVSGLLFDARQEHALAESDFHELQQLHAGSATALATARQNLTKARADMERAGRQEAAAHEREARAEQLAGIKTGISGTSIALQAMQKQAEESKQRSRAAILNAGALTNVTDTTASADDIVRRTLADPSATGGGESAQDRLARLLGKKAA
jgi:hypothetical protein